MSTSSRLVKMRVLEGGVGTVRGGRLERSRERFERREALEEEREGRGEVSMLFDIVKRS
jgi:hypothetical protein